MKLLDYRFFSLLAAAAILTACDSGGTFTGSFGGGPGTGGGAGGGGGGGGPMTATEPNMQYGPNETLGFGGIKISGDGDKIIFVDEGDPLTMNPSGDWQLFRYTITTASLVQITAGNAGDVPALFDFDLDGAGNNVTWVSSNDLAGANAAGRPQIFLAPTAGGAISQVTAFTTESAWNPQLSGNGSLVAFLSASDLVAGENPMGDDHIFTINADGSGINQVLSDAVIPQFISLSDDGSKIAFEAFGDPLGDNSDFSLEIFTVNTDGTGLTQITNSLGNSFNPILSDDGSKVIFASQQDLVAGGNADGTYEVFVADTDGSSITQISNGDDDSGTFLSGAPGAFDISGNGLWVVFTSEANLTGDNSDLTHTIFTAPADGESVAQTLREGTVSPNASSVRADQPSITNDGTGIAFESSVNLTSISQPGFDKIYTTIRQ